MSKPFQDLEGKTINDLTVTGPSEMRGHYRFWPVRCKCGIEKWVSAHNLLSEATKGCSCRRKLVGDRQRVHGLGATPTGGSWYKMLNRCYQKNNPDYPDYGGRGIKVCEFLRISPVNLVILIGLRPEGRMSIHRIDNDGNYSCGQCAECLQNNWAKNVKWATDDEQARNKRNNIWITHDGRTQLLQDWVKETGLSYTTIRRRWNRGQPITKDLRSIPKEG